MAIAAGYYYLLVVVAVSLFHIDKHLTMMNRILQRNVHNPISLLSLLLLLLCTDSAQAFVQFLRAGKGVSVSVSTSPSFIGGGNINKNKLPPTPTCTQLNAIEVPSLDALDDNHEKEASRLAKSITGWLDDEWIPQEVHVQMAESAKKSYITARNNGETEIMNVMTLVVDDLVANWREYDKDAFVNAWDIGNYVSDYLHQRIDVDSCGCSANIYNPDDE